MATLANDFLVVGLGASAGGIQALKEFFEQVPPDSHIAWVVVLHLSPEYESQLAAVLQVSAALPVSEVSGRVRVQPDHVYVIPPNQSLSMVDGHLQVSPVTRFEDRRAPVDIFFRTLAESHGPQAVSVVLSGTGANGSMGMKRIKELGGMTMAQDPEEAEFRDMPRASIATGLVDHVLPVRRMAEKILTYRDRLNVVRLPEQPSDARPSEEASLREIFAQLRTRTGHDFSNYKRATVLRRIARRMTLQNMGTVAEYASYLREHSEESQALLKDLLISVTNFFRDREAFEAVQHLIVPRLFAGKNEDDHVRVWVAGCATGEEAYSLAMLLAENAAAMPGSPSVQLFATDIDESAIAVAREGLYTLNDAADVSPERLRRFFTKEGDAYRVRKELRDMILFAHHNVIKDPPFSHLDLVSCRNLLIYLNRSAQHRVMEVMHFALNPGAYLFLGSSESVEGSGDLFVTFEKEAFLYQSRAVAARLAMPVPELSLPSTSEPRTQDDRNSEHRVRERMSAADLHQRLLEHYASPSIVVNEEHDIVHLSDRAGRYLQYAGGEPTINLLKAIRPELRIELRTALYQAAQQRTNVEAPGLVLRIDDRTVTLNLMVRPVLKDGDTARGFFLVLFEEMPEGATPREAPKPLASGDTARQLEEEVLRVKAQLRATVERHETQAEELKASNEELQSLNEELRTVNQELKIKVEEQAQANDDISNLINSTEIGTIFLDRASRIKLFTPRARDIFTLIPADRGRPLSDISSTLVDADLHLDIERVLERLERIEREVKTRDDRWQLMRVLPYRTADDRIDGIVLTFVDITERKRVEHALQLAHTELEQRVEERTSELAAVNRALDQELQERRQAEEKARGLTRRLITVQEDERRRIARDLHDHLGQQVAGLSLRIEALANRESDPATLQAINATREAIARLDRDLDFFTWELRPATLDDLGLVDTLGNFVHEWSKEFGIAAEFHSNGLDRLKLSYEVETNLYRIAQEALNNIYKHAHASHVGVILERRDHHLVLVVEDNGRGFERVEDRPSTDRGIGLLGMQERAAFVGGTLEIETASGTGTTVFVRVPIA